MKKIVGGSQTKKDAWPWMAILLYSNEINCGGTLITSDHILTAAHCADDGESPDQVRLGDYDVRYVGDTPEEMDTSSYASPKPESSIPVNSSSINSVFIFNVIEENEMTDNEKESLPESFKKLCENKPIRKSSSVYVEESIFEKNIIFSNTLLQQKSSANRKFQSSANRKYESSAGLSRSKRQVDFNDEV